MKKWGYVNKHAHGPTSAPTTARKTYTYLGIKHEKGAWMLMLPESVAVE
jgi:hypothetical protein